MITEEQFRQLLPLASSWAEEQEQIIIQDGVGLSSVGLADAATIGVASPEKIRLMRVPMIPVPNHPLLKEAALATGLISNSTVGLTLRYGIYIRGDHWGERGLIAHELVHTAQYERLGGFMPFLQQYLYECISIGYPEAPMEQEAMMVQRRICS